MAPHSKATKAARLAALKLERRSREKEAKEKKRIRNEKRAAGRRRHLFRQYDERQGGQDIRFI